MRFRNSEYSEETFLPASIFVDIKALYIGFPQPNRHIKGSILQINPKAAIPVNYTYPSWHKNNYKQEWESFLRYQKPYIFILVANLLWF